MTKHQKFFFLNLFGHARNISVCPHEPQRSFFYSFSAVYLYLYLFLFIYIFLQISVCQSKLIFFLHIIALTLGIQPRKYLRYCIVEQPVCLHRSLLARILTSVIGFQSNLSLSINLANHFQLFNEGTHSYIYKFSRKKEMEICLSILIFSSVFARILPL